jgi:hypothetical protein
MHSSKYVESKSLDFADFTEATRLSSPQVELSRSRKNSASQILSFESITPQFSSIEEVDHFRVRDASMHVIDTPPRNSPNKFLQSSPQKSNDTSDSQTLVTSLQTSSFDYLYSQTVISPDTYVNKLINDLNNIQVSEVASNADENAQSKTDDSNSTTNDNASSEMYSEQDLRNILTKQHEILTASYSENLKSVIRMFEDSPILKVKHFLKVFPLNQVLCHEEILPERVDQFFNYVMSYGLNNPICIPAIIVDMNTKVIIDGHHRFYTLQRLGLQEVEMLFVDYMHDDIVIQSSSNITKLDVIEAARSGQLLRPKLTRHLVFQNGKYVPILCMSSIISFILKIVLHQL